MEKTQSYKLKVFTDVAEYSEQEKWVAFELVWQCGVVYIGEYHWNNDGKSEIQWNDEDEPYLGENKEKIIKQIEEKIRNTVSTVNPQTKN